MWKSYIDSYEIIFILEQQRDALQAIDPDKKNKKKEKQPKNVHMTNMKAHMAKKWSFRFSFIFKYVSQ